MSYPVNSTINYSAIPYTRGYETSDHTVTWAFSDSSTYSGTNTTKTWASKGNKPFTVVAVNAITGTSATINHSIAIDTFDWTTYVEGSSLPSNTLNPIGASLSDGTLLCIGGASTACYKLSNKSWTQIGSLNRKRLSLMCVKAPNAIELSNGKVLVVGCTRDIYDNTCEVYDRVTNTWSYTGSMSNGVSKSCYPIMMNDGRVAVFGGMTSSGTPYFNGYQTYNTGTGEWTTGQDIMTPYYYSVSGSTITRITKSDDWFNDVLPPVKLANGDIFIVSPTLPIISEVVSTGPVVWKSELAYRCFVFHPATDTFTPIETRSSIFNAQWELSAISAVAKDGYVYVFGFKRNGSVGVTISMRVHPDIGIYELIAEAPIDLSNVSCAMPIEDGTKIHIVGVAAGSNNTGSIVYDTVSNTWSGVMNFVDRSILSSNANGIGYIGGNPVLFGYQGKATEIFNGC